MTQAYYNCRNLTGSPICGNNVTNMYNTYCNCINLTGSPVCGEKVVDMTQAYYNCRNLTGSPVCGNNVTNMYNTYYNCKNIYGTMLCYSKNITSFRNCFYGRDASNKLNIYVQPNSTTNNTIHYATSSNSITGSYVTWTDDMVNNCYYNTTYNIYVYPTLGMSIDKISNLYMKYSSEQLISVNYSYYMDDEIPTFTVISSDTSIVEINNINVENKTLTFSVKSGSIDGKSTISITGNVVSLNGISNTDTKQFNIVVNENGEALPVNYEVLPVEGASYGFELNDNDYYESQNFGVSSSYSLCKIILTCDGVCNLYLDCINYGENGWDYGILSNVDQELSLNNNADSNYYKSFSSSSSSNVQTIDYGVLDAGEHFIYIKYRKDGSVDSGNDSLQFKVRLE